MPSKTCPVCGLEWYASASSKAIFCDQKCYGESKRRPKRRKQSNPKSTLHSKRITSAGYVMIKTSAGWILEHRMITEKYLGRKLSSNEVVHHKNGNKSDNRVDNLEVMSRCAHSTHHSHDMRLRIRSLDWLDLALLGEETGKLRDKYLFLTEN